VVEIHDDLLGPVRALVDDVVLQRNDGVPAYNLAVVVDDAAQGVQQVVRGDDLASSAPRQRFLADALGLSPVTYAHVALVLGPAGQRLAKRDGAVTLGEQAALGHPPEVVCGWLAWSIGLIDAPEPVLAGDLVAGFDPRRLRREAWTFDADTVGA
jgi:glutamyl-tRNA synthetase